MKKLGILIGLLWCAAVSAQSDLTLYNFNAIPQSLHTNPAYPQQTKLWIGLPAISGVSMSYHNSGFALIDLFERGTDINQNFDAMLAKLDDKSHLAVTEGLDLMNVGFRAGKSFWSFGVTQSFDYRMDYPVDLLRLVRYGNAPAEFRNSNLNNFDYEVLNRINFYVGMQRNINDKLSLGGRFKYIRGQQHVHAERTQAGIYTEDNSTLRIESDILFRTAGVSNLLELDGLAMDASTLLPKNNGFAIDLGGHYKFDDKWSFSASLLDIGYIDWNANTREYISEGSFEFDGFEADLTADQPIENFNQIVDSLGNAFRFEERDGTAYRSWLSARGFLAANYHLSKRHTVGALYHVRRWQGENFHDISVNYQGRLSRTFQFTANYAVINGTYNNVGAGFDLKLGAIQLYVLCDNVLGGLMYENLQTTSVRAGVNLTFYGKKDKKVIPTEVPEVMPSDEES